MTHDSDGPQRAARRDDGPAGLSSPGISINDLAELLFCSSLQPSQPADVETIREAMSISLRNHHGNVAECAGELAECYGEHPEVTQLRMRWCRDLLAHLFPEDPLPQAS